MAEYIGLLDDASPGFNDPISEGDDQIRETKKACVQSFPNVTGEVALTHTEINNLKPDVAGLYTAIVPQGCILMWSGAETAVPTGWALCDGSTVDDVVTPDLRQRFILGSTGDAGDDPTGGTGDAPVDATITSSAEGGHNHSGVTGNFASTLRTYGSGTSRYNIDDQLHNHSISTAPAHSHDTVVPYPRPAYYALAYIMRTADDPVPAT